MSDARHLPPSDDVSLVTDDLGIEPEEREEIEREIDLLVSESSGESSLLREHLQPRRSGALLPLLVWTLAAGAFAAGFYFISQYFEVREESITVESRAFFSTEGQLIEEILRESEERLAEKDEEINEIQGRLARLDAERANLEANLEEQVANREAELRAQLQAELAAERERLAAAGESQATIDARIAEIEAQRQTQVEAEIDSFRAEAQAELAELQAQLAQQEAALQQTLEASREERERIAEEAAEREAELRAEFTQEIAQLEEAERAALERVQELQQLAERESLLTDRVLGSFTVIVEDIEEGLTEEALAGLASLERLLLGEGVGTEERRRRRETELSLVTTLRGLVQEVDVLRQNIAIRDFTTTTEETDRLEQERAAGLIATAADTVALAEAARQAGRFGEARSLYQQALATIPSLEAVYPGIIDLEETRRRLALTSAVSDAQTLLAAGNPQEAVDRYLESVRSIAAGENDPLLEVADGIDLAVASTRDAILAAQTDVQQTLRQQIGQRDEQIAALTRNLNAATNATQTANATVATLRETITELEDELEAARAATGQRAAELTALERRVAELEDEASAAGTDLAAAQTRADSLASSLGDAQTRIGELEADLSAAERRATTAERALQTANGELAAAEEARAALVEQIADLREAAAAAPETPDEPGDGAATAEELAELEAALAEAERALAAAQRSVDERQAQIEELQGTLASTREQLTASRSDADGVRAQLDEANAQIAGLEQRIESLQEGREVATGEAAELQEEIASLQARVDELEQLESRVTTLASRYGRAAQSAQARLEDGAYGQARAEILGPFSAPAAASLFPGFVSTLETAHQGIVTETASATTGEVRIGTIDDIVNLATEIQQNIARPRDAVSVQSYLAREPDLEPVANELFEIVELSARAISAPEIEYRLLGSVSRITGNLVVVERLVALEPEVGERVEIRRTPTLGEEIAIGLGTILEVTDRRVVVSIDETYRLDAPPAVRDLVYIAVE